MELLGRALRAGRIFLLSAYGCLLFFSGSFCLAARAETEAYPIVYDISASNSDDYIEIEDVSGTYEVLPGDCLWAISEKLWGDGSRYVDIVKDNQGIIKDPNLIYPGMLLQVGQTGYIKKDSRSRIEMPQYCFRIPDTWTVVYVEEGEPYTNFVLAGGKLCCIACMIQDKEEATVQITQDWEVYSKLVQDYVDEQYQDAISDFTLEHYRTGESEEMYLYSSIYEADLTEFGIDGEGKINICAGLKLTENIQAEFIGFAYDYDIHGAVRYITADFEELSR